jgi:hypothetical protein
MFEVVSPTQRLRCLKPLPGMNQPGTSAVILHPLAGGAPHRLDRSEGVGVFVEPAGERRPLPEQCLMRNFDDNRRVPGTFNRATVTDE